MALGCFCAPASAQQRPTRPGRLPGRPAADPADQPPAEPPGDPAADPAAEPTGNRAAGPSRLGTLIRWYLREESPARREDYLESIETLVAGDAAKVVAAIRAGDHIKFPETPVLKTGGALPKFSQRRPRLRPVADSAGTYAQLIVPKDYDSKRAYQLIVELAPSNWGGLSEPADAVILRVHVSKHAQAVAHAWAAEYLVLSLIAHVQELVRLDPTRTFLRADGAVASLAWYIALNNPDRFGGLLASRGDWVGGAGLAENATAFSTLIFARDKHTLLSRALKYKGARTLVLDVPTTAATKGDARIRMAEWFDATKRSRTTRRVMLAAGRPTPTRSFWLKASPRPRAEQETRVGKRWTARSLKRPGTIMATILANNLVEVVTKRINSFELHVDPELFDLSKPLRIKVNGRVPESHLIYPEVAAVLEDFRRRRDPLRLYPFKVTVSVRER